MANSHRRYNHLSVLEVDGVIYEDEAEVAAQVGGASPSCSTTAALFLGCDWSEG